MDLFHDSVQYCHANMFGTADEEEDGDSRLELRRLHTFVRRSSSATGPIIITIVVILVVAGGCALCFCDSKRRKNKRQARQDDAATLDAALDNVEDRYTGFQGRGNHPSNQPIKMSGPWPEELEPKTPTQESTGGVRGFYEGSGGNQPAAASSDLSEVRQARYA